jgi:hypothetical protein
LLLEAPFFLFDFRISTIVFSSGVFFWNSILVTFFQNFIFFFLRFCNYFWNPYFLFSSEFPCF